MNTTSLVVECLSLVWNVFCYRFTKIDIFIFYNLLRLPLRKVYGLQRSLKIVWKFILAFFWPAYIYFYERSVYLYVFNIVVVVRLYRSYLYMYVQLNYRSIRENRFIHGQQEIEKEENHHQKAYTQPLLQWILHIWSSLWTDTGTR